MGIIPKSFGMPRLNFQFSKYMQVNPMPKNAVKQKRNLYVIWFSRNKLCIKVEAHSEIFPAA